VADDERPGVRSRLESWQQTRATQREIQEAQWAAFPNLDGFHLELRVVGASGTY
jgi:hypothetical protein